MTIKKFIQRAGLPTIYVGVALLVALYALGLTRHTALMLVGLALEILGTCLYIVSQKGKSDY